MRTSDKAAFISFLNVFFEFITLIKHFLRFVSGVVAVVSLFYLACNLRRIFLSRFFWLPTLYACYLAFYEFFCPNPLFDTSHNYYLLIAGFVKYFCPIGMFLSLVSNSDYRAFKRFVMWSGIFLAVMAILTIRADIGTSRVMVGLNNGRNIDSMYAAVDAVYTGAWGYASIHSIPFVVFGALICVRQSGRGKTRWIMLIFSVLYFIAVIRSGFGTAGLLSLLLIAFSIVKVKHLIPFLCFLVFTGIIFAIFWKMGTIGEVSQWAAMQFEEGNVITSKLEEIAMANRGNVQGDAFERVERYKESIDGFCMHPFLGGGWKTLKGGHAYILDMFAVQGICGFLMFMICYLGVFLKIQSFLPRSLRNFYSIGFLVSLTMMSLKNLSYISHASVLFFIMPSFMVLREDYYEEISCRVRQYLQLPPKPVLF